MELVLHRSRLVCLKEEPRDCHIVRSCSNVGLTEIFRFRLQLKKVLSSIPEAPLNVESLMEDHDFRSMITREKFEELAIPILDRIPGVLQQVHCKRPGVLPRFVCIPAMKLERSTHLFDKASVTACTVGYTARSCLKLHLDELCLLRRLRQYAPGDCHNSTRAGLLNDLMHVACIHMSCKGLTCTNYALQSLAESRVSPEDVVAVEVVGGSSRVPAVITRLRAFYKREPSRTLNAKEVVARGCALNCAMLSPIFRSVLDICSAAVALHGNIKSMCTPPRAANHDGEGTERHYHA